MHALTPPHAERVAELFDRILEADPGSRGDVLAQLASEPAEVADEVRSLLQAYDASGTFLSLLDPQLSSLLLHADEASGAPTRAGPFRLLDEIGRGGMGAVYLAERVEGGFTQRAAVKVLKRGMDSDAIVARFVRERGILARLEHPGIARLLDGGAADDHRPYFAMEYVEGETLLDWCDARRLPIHGRLELFESVCHSVQYAHARLVVHRDLKPANILVTPDGQPKLLDFGIAKVISAESDDESLATLGGRHIMTPDYASPEQVRGEAVTVATDVYALGLLLFELLAGRRQLSFSSLTPADLERTICETPAAPPSSTVSDAADDRVADARGLRPHQLRRRLQGDLDTIVLRAVAKEPEQRYASAAALADDVRAFLDGLPIKARPESRVYRARKLIARHRGAVAAAATIVVALVTGAGFALWQGRVAGQERDRAQLEALRAQQVQAFLTDLFEASDPQESRGDEVTARELLERGEQRIDHELADQPAAQAELSSVIGGVYLGLGRYELAERRFRRGVELSRSGPATDPSRLSRLLKQLGEALTAQGEYSESLEPLEESLTLRQRLSGPESAEAGESLDALGISHHYAGNLERAGTLYRQALSIVTAEWGPDHPATLATLNNLANLVSAQGRFDEAIELHRRILDLSLPIYGEVHPEIAVSLSNLATSLRKRGFLSEAQRTLDRALAIKTRLYGDQHPSLTTTRNNLGVTLRSLGRYEDAEVLFARVLAEDRASLSPDHPFLAYSLDNLASVVSEQVRTAEAFELLDAAREIHLRASGADSIDYGAHLSIRARTLEIEGRFAGASSVLEASLVIHRSVLGPDHPRTARNLNSMGRLTAALEGHRAAEVFFEQALAIQESSLP